MISPPLVYDYCTKYEQLKAIIVLKKENFFKKTLDNVLKRN